MRWLLKMSTNVGPAAGAACAAGIEARRATAGTEGGGTVAGRRAAAGMAPSAPIEGGGGGGWERRMAGFPPAAAARFDSGRVGGRPGTASGPVPAAGAPAAA